jgi:hypothetical protein
MSNFNSKVNFSNQIKQYENTTGTLSGSVNVEQYTILGTDYLDLPLGLDSTTSGITSSNTPVSYDSFTGTTGSTTFYFSDPNMELGIPYLSAITSSNSGITQYITVFVPTYTTIVDGNSFDINFSGVSFDVQPLSLVEYSPGLFSGYTNTNEVNYLSGTTYPWWYLKSGSTTWNEIKGRTKTDRLTVTENATPNYVLTALNSDGDAVWLPQGSFSGNTSGNCITDLWVTNLHGCSPINVWDQFQNLTCSATGQSSNAFGYYTKAFGDYSHAEGRFNFAFGNNSHAEGNVPDVNANIANGVGSHVEGTQTIANGDVSHAEGHTTTTNGYASHAEGYNTTTVGNQSHAEGATTITYGFASHTEGLQSKSFGDYSHAEGANNISNLVYLLCDYVSGASSTFIIDSTHGNVTPYFNIGDNLFVSDVHSNKNFLVSVNEYTIDDVTYQEISPSVSGTVITLFTDLGFSDDTGIYISNLTTLLEPDLIPFSYCNYGSHAEGCYYDTTLPPSNLLGNISFGNGSHAEGIFDDNYFNIAYGLGSHAQGYRSKAIGDYSHSSGFNVYSDGISSFIHSFNSYIKNGNSSSIIGGFNNNINLSDNSSILGGSSNTITNNSDNSSIIGGNNNDISNLNNTVIIGGSNIIATRSDSVYVPNLVISQPYVPSSSGDTNSDVGTISWDDSYMYIKTNTGWGRINLDYGF